MTAAAHETEEIHIAPNPGPQSAAFASTADITIYGGAAGGGKSWLTLLRFAVHADRYAGFAGVIFRRTMPMVLAGGGLWEESKLIFTPFGAVPNSSLFQWRFRNSSMVQFRGLQHATDVLDYQGAQFAEIGFEELTHFLESQFWYLISRLRTKCGMKARVLATCNPDADSWVRNLIEWWIGSDGLVIPERDGKRRYFLRDGDTLVWGDSPDEVKDKCPHLTARPFSLRFIRAMLSDNPKGDPDYRAKLEALPKIEREKLLGGNWNARPVAGTFFKRSYFEIIDAWPGRIKRRVRAWDLAGTEPTPDNKDPDWTVGLRLAELDDTRWLIEHVERIRVSPGKVEDALKRIAKQDGIACKQLFWRDPAQAGKWQANHIVTVLKGFHVGFITATKNKETYAGPVSSLAEHGKILMVRGAWNEPFLSVLEGFPGPGHDDDVDALSRAALEFTGGVLEYNSDYDEMIPSLRT